jgi:hypothetical protein
MSAPTGSPPPGSLGPKHTHDQFYGPGLSQNSGSSSRALPGTTAVTVRRAPGLGNLPKDVLANILAKNPPGAPALGTVSRGFHAASVWSQNFR